MPRSFSRKHQEARASHGLQAPRLIVADPGIDLARFVHGSRVPDAEKPHQIINIPLKAGQQVRITPTVKEFTSQFGKPRSVSDIAEIAAAVRHQIRLSRVDGKIARELYAKRTATDIIQSRKALAADPGLWKAVPMLGCVDHGLALVATLKALGVPASFGRRGQRTLVFLKFKGKDYVVDPSRHTKKPMPEELSPPELRHYEWLTSVGGFNKGMDARSIGIKSIYDFNKYVSMHDSLFMR